MIQMCLMLSLAGAPAWAGPMAGGALSGPGGNQENHELDPAIDIGAFENGIADDIEVNDVRNASYFDGLLTVNFRDEPAGGALSEIADLAGFTLKIDQATQDRRLSVRFSELPLEKALDRIIGLLETGNFRFSYDDKGQISEVIIEAGPQSGAGPAVSRPPAQRGPAVSAPRPNTSPGSRPSSRRRRVRPRRNP